MAEGKKDIRLNIRMPQYLKDKVEQEAKRLDLNQSEFIRHLIIAYFAKQEKE